MRDKYIVGARYRVVFEGIMRQRHDDDPRQYLQTISPRGYASDNIHNLYCAWAVELIAPDESASDLHNISTNAKRIMIDEDMFVEYPDGVNGLSAPVLVHHKKPTAVRTFSLPYDFNDPVIIDGREDLVAHVTGYNFRDTKCEVEVSWWNERTNVTAWFSIDRVAPAPSPKPGKVL